MHRGHTERNVWPLPVPGAPAPSVAAIWSTRAPVSPKQETDLSLTLDSLPVAERGRGSWVGGPVAPSRCLLLIEDPLCISQEGQRGGTVAVFVPTRRVNVGLEVGKGVGLCGRAEGF